MAGDVYVAVDRQTVGASSTAFSNSSDLGGKTCKGYLVFCTYATALNSATADTGIAIGMSDGTTEGGASMTLANADGSNNGSTYTNSTDPIRLLDAGASTDHIHLTHSSLDTNGCTLGTTTRDTAVLATAVMFAGDDVACKVVNKAIDATAGNSVTVTHDLNSSNYMVFITGTRQVVADQSNTGASGIGFGVGHWNGTAITQRAVLSGRDDGVPTSETSADISSAGTPRIWFVNNAGNGAVDVSVEMTNATSTTFDLTTRNGGQASLVHILVVDLDDRTGWVGSVDSPNDDTSAWDSPDVGFTPQAIGLAMTTLTATDTFTTDATSEPFGLGFASENFESSVATVGDDGVGTSDEDSFHSDDFVYLQSSAGGGVIYNAQSPTFDSTGWTVSAANNVTNSATTHKWFGWAIEARAAGAVTSFIPSNHNIPRSMQTILTR